MEKRYGVICYFPRRKQDDVVLITSRGTKRWIFPKGRKMRGMSGPASAKREAYEEAGLRGRIDKRIKFRIRTEQAGERIELLLYAMRVEKLTKRWPEMRERTRLITSGGKAEKLLECPKTSRALREVLRKAKH